MPKSLPWHLEPQHWHRHKLRGVESRIIVWLVFGLLVFDAIFAPRFNRP